jgi:hypothetical protein
MKTKKVSKKPGLKKRTVANLNSSGLNEVKGGETMGCTVTQGGAICEWSAQCYTLETLDTCGGACYTGQTCNGTF